MTSVLPRKTSQNLRAVNPDPEGGALGAPREDPGGGISRLPGRADLRLKT